MARRHRHRRPGARSRRFLSSPLPAPTPPPFQGGGREGGPAAGSAGVPPASREARTRMRAFGRPGRRDAGASRQFTDERDREYPRPGYGPPGQPPSRPPPGQSHLRIRLHSSPPSREEESGWRRRRAAPKFPNAVAPAPGTTGVDRVGNICYLQGHVRHRPRAARTGSASAGPAGVPGMARPSARRPSRGVPRNASVSARPRPEPAGMDRNKPERTRINRNRPE